MTTVEQRATASAEPPEHQEGPPVGLGLLLWVAWRRTEVMHGYVYPRWLLVIGALAWLATFGVGVPAVMALLEGI